MQNYFENCTTIDQAKKQYRKLAFELHPDRGGNEIQFKELLNQFENFRPTGKEKYKGEFEDFQQNAGQFADLVNQLLNIDGITVEVIGNWLWLGGNTYDNKDKIKAIDAEAYGFKSPRFSRSKSKWYFSPIGYKKRSKKRYDMDKIRSMYGSQQYNGRKEEKEDQTRLEVA